MIQRYQLDEAAFRGDRFRHHPKDLKGDNDLLCLTQPQIIGEIHRQYFEAGADVATTNTFNGTIAQHGTASKRCARSRARRRRIARAGRRGQRDVQAP